MPPEIRLTPAAERDLIEICLFTADRWDPRQADLYLEEIETAMSRIRDHPEIGSDCSEVLPGYRKLPVGSHRIYYRLPEGSIEIVRILHARMDAPSRLDE